MKVSVDTITVAVFEELGPLLKSLRPASPTQPSTITTPFPKRLSNILKKLPGDREVSVEKLSFSLSDIPQSRNISLNVKTITEKGGHNTDWLTEKVMRVKTEPSKQPIRTSYLGYVSGYQPIRDQYFLIRSVASMKVSVDTITVAVFEKLGPLLKSLRPASPTQPSTITTPFPKRLSNILKKLPGDREVSVEKLSFSLSDIPQSREPRQRPKTPVTPTLLNPHSSLPSALLTPLTPIESLPPLLNPLPPTDSYRHALSNPLSLHIFIMSMSGLMAKHHKTPQDHATIKQQHARAVFTPLPTRHNNPLIRTGKWSKLLHASISSCILGVHVQDFQTTFQEPTEPSKQPIRTSYLVHVTGYQPIRDQYFIIRSIPATFTIKTINERVEKFSGKATRK
eukprot:sb/3465447/